MPLVLLFCVTPTIADDEKPLSAANHHFGIVCNPYNRDWENPEKTTSLLKDLGVKLVICKLSWADIEVEKGKLSETGWKKYDEVVDKLTGCGIDVMCLIAAIPEWAKDASDKKPRTGMSPKNPKDLADFVTVAAKRYKDKIKRWAFFNSPQSKKHHFQPEHLVELYRAGSQAVKGVIPDSIIVMPGLEGIISKRGPYLEKFLQAGGGKYVDMYDFHMNLGGGAHFSAAASETNALKEILRRYGQHEKPIQYGAIATPNRAEPKEKRVKRLMARSEWKPVDFEQITPELQAVRLVTLMIWGRSLGVDRIFWTRTRDHAPASGPKFEEWVARKKKRKPKMRKEKGFNRTMGLINSDYEPKPCYHAFKTLIEKLDTATFLKEINIGEDAKAFVFQKEGKYIAALWTWQGERSLTFGIDAKGVDVTDLYGKIISHIDTSNGKLTLRLTSSVIYVEGDFKELVAS